MGVGRGLLCDVGVRCMTYPVSSACSDAVVWSFNIRHVIITLGTNTSFLSHISIATLNVNMPGF